MKCKWCEDAVMVLIDHGIIEDEEDHGKSFVGSDYTEWQCEQCKKKARKVEIQFTERDNYKKPEPTSIPLKRYPRIPTYPVPLGKKKLK